MQTLLLGLRGCPVAPALRNIWGTGKLIELLTLLLPPPADPAPAQAQSRVLHPALRAVIDYMTAHLAEPIGLPEMAAAVHSSPSHLSRLFTAEFGHGPTIHLRRLRLDHAAALLRSGQANVTEAALAAGYQSLGQFSRAFSEHHGRPPSALIPRNNG
jgi:transcriptional regulator GlxA family with amidase domain